MEYRAGLLTYRRVQINGKTTTNQSHDDTIAMISQDPDNIRLTLRSADENELVSPSG